MRNDAKAIEHLNNILGNELIAINQYFLHSRMLKDWGFEKLASKEYEESIDEMKHADQLIERILFLKGIPNLQNLGKINIGENTGEIFQCDVNLEYVAIEALKEAIPYFESTRDFISRDLLQNILQSEEEHVGWLETQLDLIKLLGEKHYLLSQV
jgi:bacterioferritin